jgi:hypothetical protein
MKKIASLLIIFATFSATYAQNLDGVWVSTGKQKKTHNADILLDFDSKTIGNINSNASGKIVVNRKATKMKADGIKGKLNVQKRGKNTLILNGKNTYYILNKLNTAGKVNMTKKELGRFLTDQFCDEIQGIKAQFTKEQFFLDKKAKKAHKRNQFINYSQRDNGYWFIKKFKGYALLVFTTGQNKSENIFQIESVSLNGLKLNQLQNSAQVKNLTQIKTCL